MPLANVSSYERFFRAAASLDIDKSDIKRHSDFVHRKLYDLLLMSQAAAKFNQRDVIEFWDIPLTKGLQESIHRFEALRVQLDLEAILQGLAQLPSLDLEYSEETRSRLPMLCGGLSFALARTFKILDPDLKNPQTRHWEAAFRLFDLVL